METSSPLAAMRPPPAPFGQRGLFQSHHAYPHLSMNPRGSGTFGLRDQFTNHLQRPYPDYLNSKSVQGSSPAASLAADLSQNFTITDTR